MKKILAMLLLVTALFGLTACVNSGNSGDGAGGGTEITKPDSGGSGGEINKPGDGGNASGGTVNPPETTDTGILIAYFSCTNNTGTVAQHIQTVTGGTLYEIVPEVPYTADDLKYYTDCRADREQNDPTARPAVSGEVGNMQRYDVVFVGYPIWHGQAPKIIYTFLESYDFSGKTVVPFCTSASSGIGSSDTNLHSLAPQAEWKGGRRFSAGTEQSAVESWIEGLNLKLPSATDGEEITKMFITVNGNKIEVTLVENSSVDALIEILKQGDITYTADDYGDFEKVGNIGHTLPQNNTQITTQAGDVILYQGNNICLYYGTNSWNFTRIGKINGYAAAEMRSLLGADNGSVQVVISLK